MPLLARCQLQRSVGEIRSADLGVRVLHERSVEPRAIVMNEAARLALRRRKARADEKLRDGDARIQFGLGQTDAGQARGILAVLEGAPGRVGRIAGRLLAMRQPGRFRRKDPLRLVDLRSLQLAETLASSSGSSVNSRRKRATSSSSVLRQNCQNS